MGAIKDFITHHYRHFNAAVVIDAAQAYVDHLDRGRQDVRHAGRRHEHGRAGPLAGRDDPAGQGPRHLLHRRQPRRGHLQPRGPRPLRARAQLPQALRPGRGRAAEPGPQPRHGHLHPRRRGDAPDRAPHARRSGRRHRTRASATSPTSTSTSSSRAACSRSAYQIDPKDSWLLAACEKKLPVFVPGWEDSTLGNIFVAAAIRGDVNYDCVKSGLEQMGELVDWYKTNTARSTSIGFFQIGGGIAGDFPICVVPLIQQDLQAGLPPLGLLLPDLRQHHVLRLVQRRRARTRRSPGASSPSTRRASSSSPTRRSWRR